MRWVLFALLLPVLVFAEDEKKSTVDVKKLVKATRNIDFDPLDGEFVVEEIELPEGSGQEQSMVMMRMISRLYPRTALRDEELRPVLEQRAGGPIPSDEIEKNDKELAPRLRELFEEKED